MANDNQFPTRTVFIATRGVREYRATISQVLRPDDSVLEIGCGWGHHDGAPGPASRMGAGDGHQPRLCSPCASHAPGH